jgi:hypothetical protein
MTGKKERANSIQKAGISCYKNKVNVQGAAAQGVFLLACGC